MARPEPKKRKLNFDAPEQMIAEAQALLDSGYVAHGKWTLGQACGHVADWARYPMDGFPVPPLPIKILLWLMKVTIGPGLKKKILAEGFSGGMQTAPESIPDPDQTTDQRELDKLKATMDRIQSFTGELNPSPLFGPMDREMLIKVTLLHAEHHFGYFEPK